MWDAFVIGVGIMMFIDLCRWGIADEYSTIRRRSFFGWMFNSLVGNAFWMVIFIVVYKFFVWVFA